MGIEPKIAMARLAYESVLSQLRPTDEAALFTFDSSLHERQGFTQDLSRLQNGLSEFEPFGTTSLYDATAAAARRLGGPFRNTSRDGGVHRRDRHEQPPDGGGSVRARGLHRRPGLHRGNRAFRRSTRDDGDGGARRAVGYRGSSRSGGMDRRTAAIRQHPDRDGVVAAGIVGELRQQYVLAIEAPRSTNGAAFISASRILP